MSAQEMTSAEQAQGMAETCEREAAFAEETAARMAGSPAIADAVKAWRDSAAGLWRAAKAFRTLVALHALTARLTRERDDARVDFSASEALMAPLVRAWEAADEDSRSLADLHVPGLREAIEEIRDGRDGAWWETPR